ncbi:MAG: tyrosine-type recombinase/integrase [Clostridia bacterium]|nr:tyrosine-type recombinase/integrase [Clostridia bacterium]
MKTYLEEYKIYLREVKRCSDNTFEAYIRDLEQFIKYCTAQDISSLNNIKEEHINEYLSYILNNGRAASNKTLFIASIRCYFKFLSDKGYVDTNCAQALKNPRNAQKMPDILTSNEVVTLLSQPCGKDYKSIRDRAMLELLYATGIKVSELIELTVGDVNLQIGILHIKSQNHERIVPIYQTAVKHLSDYLSMARPALVSDGREDKLFTNYSGKPMSRQGFWKIIKFYSKKAGINKDITPQTLRHSFAAHLLENGAQLSDIKDMLGHLDISSTQVYAQLVKSKYIQSYSKFHPLAK